MKSIKMFTALLLVFGVVFSGCSSKEVVLEKVPPKNYEVLGKAEGTGSGSLGLLGTAYYFVPMGLNTRVENAYDDALESVEGSTGLMNVTFQEDWYWWVIGTNRKVTITGDALKEVEK
ncbi:MAG: hypothetical protein PHX44_01370 [Sulfurimonas sp.]|uniref:hypothetical protein n=1 Tax=Sulfurimonas sp. TaxID=2022749 RepID=UPI0026216446|nr:hypothetical protein [Sulfurimonas sp.]MDD2651683.1 hypothetical protein [Sulfurimonas sp.]MDD3451494.1 hypothetical protein [Sulfurimonas sp.]